MNAATSWVVCMGFPERLSSLRKDRGLTQQALAKKVGVNLSQIHRYEAGTTLPTFDVLRSLAVALNVSSDALLFDEKERGPDENLRLHFEAVSKLDEEDQRVVRSVIEGLVVKAEARRWNDAA